MIIDRLTILLMIGLFWLGVGVGCLINKSTYSDEKSETTYNDEPEPREANYSEEYRNAFKGRKR